jgi:hypothetical protein
MFRAGGGLSGLASGALLIGIDDLLRDLRDEVLHKPVGLLSGKGSNSSLGGAEPWRQRVHPHNSGMSCSVLRGQYTGRDVPLTGPPGDVTTLHLMM